MKTIALIIPYFGKFPEWAPLYFETLKRNSTIDFIFYTDCDIEQYQAPNIKYKKLSFQEYIDSVNSKIEVEFKPANAYKLCDLRPLYAKVHYEDIKSYDFYGWTDMDLLFGDIRSFYTEDVLNKYDVLSTHEIRISGHLALFRNTRTNRKQYRKIYNWKEHLTHPHFVGIDEHGITNAYTMTMVDKLNEKFKLSINNALTRLLKKLKTRRVYLKEQYTTPFSTIEWMDGSRYSDHPETWYYKDGVITNSRDGKRKFIYIHFMNFKSSQWRHDGTTAPWEGKDKLCFAKVADMKSGIVINTDGIFSMVDKGL